MGQSAGCRSSHHGHALLLFDRRSAPPTLLSFQGDCFCLSFHYPTFIELAQLMLEFIRCFIAIDALPLPVLFDFGFGFS